MGQEADRLTKSLEDYLESIYLLKKNKGEARLTDIALELKCTKPSVNRAVSSLREEGLLIQEKYGQITLTEKGEKTAKKIYFRHKTLLDFLTYNLGVDVKTAHEDACKMEHVISKETLTKLVCYMKNAKTKNT